MVNHETILEVKLNKPILPNSSVTFDLEFDAQVPLQVRRSGRDNAEGVRYSMSQWYPKMCEYDYEGWHPTPLCSEGILRGVGRLRCIHYHR